MTEQMFGNGALISLKLFHVHISLVSVAGIAHTFRR